MLTSARLGPPERGEGSDPRQRRKVGIAAVERVKGVRPGWDWADWAGVVTVCWLMKQPVAFRCRF